jgi:hypothetical protein
LVIEMRAPGDAKQPRQQLPAFLGWNQIFGERSMKERARSWWKESIQRISLFVFFKFLRTA